MVIGKHQRWEHPIEPARWPQVGSDAALAELVAPSGADQPGGTAPEEGAPGASPNNVIQLTGGDLLAMLGGPRPTGTDPVAYRIDVGWIQWDQRDPIAFVAHVLLHRWAWTGEAAVIMNASHAGSWYLGPKAHPNDGLLDVTWGRLGWQQRWQARRRVESGTHLPHPALRMRRVSQWAHRFDRPTPIIIDGQRHGRAREIQAWVVPDAIWVTN